MKWTLPIASYLGLLVTATVATAQVDDPRGETARSRSITLGNGVALEMVWIPPGTFTMGSPESEQGRDNDEKEHRVTLTKGFWMGKFEVTQEQWQAVMGNNPSEFKGAKLPVEQVSWDDCQSFLQNLNRVSGIGRRVSLGQFRLPTEAEWEYACRAGRTVPYAGDLAVMGWYDKISESKTHPGGQKQPNAWGLYDMHGNVWEWCQDRGGDYPGCAVTDPEGALSGSFRVFRGGSWDFTAVGCRSANRLRYVPIYRYDDLGVRVVLAPAP